jgi:hypothetical protein
MPKNEGIVHTRRPRNEPGASGVNSPGTKRRGGPCPKRRFRDKFGRDTRPEDPIFYDPVADEPCLLNLDTATWEITEGLRQAGPETGVGPALIEAWCGWVKDNRHLFSASDIAAWTAPGPRQSAVTLASTRMVMTSTATRNPTRTYLETRSAVGRTSSPATVAHKTLEETYGWPGCWTIREFPTRRP